MNHNETSTAAYWAKRNAQIEADETEANEYAQSYTGRLEAAQRRLDLVTNDASAYTDADRADALTAIAALKSEADMAFAAVWTLPVTVARRAEWNALVRGGAFGKAKADVRKVAQQEQAQGWTVEDLKRAVTMHRL